MLATPNGQETHKRNLHASEGAQRIPRRVANIQPGAIPAHADEHKRMQRQQIGNEHITTPRANHVPIEERTHGAPKHGAILDRLDPQEEGEDEQENSNGLVVVATGHGARNVSGRDAHEGGGEEASRRRVDHLRREQVRGQGGETGEGGREENANVADVDGEREEAQ